LNQDSGSSGNSGSSANDDTVSYDNDDQTPLERAAEIQNILICMEMLLFSIAHWCVFPSEEWEPDYRPKEYASPGIGIKDFASDLSFIMSSKSDARAFRKASSSSPSSPTDEATEVDEERGVLDDNYDENDGIDGGESSLTLEEEPPYESKLE
jgi:hypothetical protein